MLKFWCHKVLHVTYTGVKVLLMKTNTKPMNQPNYKSSRLYNKADTCSCTSLSFSTSCLPVVSFQFTTIKRKIFWKFSQTVVYIIFICNIFLLVLRVFFVFKSFPFNLLALRKSNKFNVNGRAPLFCVEGKNGGKPFYCRRA